jgi:hypothetical protein
VGILDKLRGTTDPTVDLVERVDELSQALRGEQETSLLLEESLADLELSLEDASWRRLTADGTMEFSRAGLKQISALCRLMAVKNPLVKRGLNLRAVYVWGLGLQLSARAVGGEDGEQDVNAVVQAFLDDPGNKAVLCSDQAHEEKERSLGTDGNVFVVCFTLPKAGRVQVRTILFEEVEDIICDPEDRATPWYYKRQWQQVTTDLATGNPVTTTRVDYYPALGYQPKPGARRAKIGDAPVHWDSPVLHVKVNTPWDGAKFGIPDAYAAIDWARAYKDFLEDWARLVKSLSRFAWRATAPASKAAKVAAKISAAPTADPMTARPLNAGASAVMAPGQTLEAIPKTGATIDSGSGRPLAMMVAAALDVPVTMLLADPGQTGARATAETLDRPTGLMAGMRRRVWTAAFTELLNYVVDQAVIAKKLQGTVRYDETGQRVVELSGDTDRTVEVSWPNLDELDIDKQMQAISLADATNKMPPLVTLRLMLETLGVQDVDEVLADMTDDNGDFINPGVSAGQVAVNAFRAGQDPVGALTGEPAAAGAAPAVDAGPAQ